MSDETMAAKLVTLGYIETVSLGIRNKIQHVDANRVCVRSERTDNDRWITSQSIRD